MGHFILGFLVGAIIMCVLGIFIEIKWGKTPHYEPEDDFITESKPNAKSIEESLLAILRDKKNAPHIIVQCNGCGRFIGKEDFKNDNVKVIHIPDTPLTTEETLYEHKKCFNKTVNL